MNQAKQSHLLVTGQLPGINRITEGSLYLKIKEKARGFLDEIDQASNNLRTRI